MRLVSIVMFSFLVFSISRAQQICPVEVEWAGIRINHFSNDVNVPEVRVRFRNASGKEIVGIKFGAVFFDAVDEPFEEYVDYMAQPPWESNWGTIKKSWDSKKAASGKPEGILAPGQSVKVKEGMDFRVTDTGQS